MDSRQPAGLLALAACSTPTTSTSGRQTAYAAGANWNDTFWEHERFNKILVEARAELDQQKRGGMYAEMQLILRDEGGVVVPMFNNYVFALRSNVKHDVMVGNWAQDGENLASDLSRFSQNFLSGDGLEVVKFATELKKDPGKFRGLPLCI